MSVTIDSELLQHVARLAKLKLSPSDEKAYTTKLKTVLDYVDLLQQCPIDDLPESELAAWESSANFFTDDGIRKDTADLKAVLCGIDEKLFDKHASFERSDTHYDAINDGIEGAEKSQPLSIKEFIEQAPASAGTSFQVPKIIE